jgi:hypothetical protein
MATVYKLTDRNMQTYGGTQWRLGETRRASGEGDLCGPGWLHAYEHSLLAVLHNPAHANFPEDNILLFSGNTGAGIIEREGQLKLGTTELTLTEEMPLPVVTNEQRVAYGIYAALEVCPAPWFVTWAQDWLSGKDRSRAAAWAAKSAAWAAKSAAWAMADTGRSAAWAAWAAKWAADSEKSLDLVICAEKAMKIT